MPKAGIFQRAINYRVDPNTGLLWIFRKRSYLPCVPESKVLSRIRIAHDKGGIGESKVQLMNYEDWRTGLLSLRTLRITFEDVFNVRDMNRRGKHNYFTLPEFTNLSSYSVWILSGPYHCLVEVSALPSI